MILFILKNHDILCEVKKTHASGQKALVLEKVSRRMMLAEEKLRRTICQ